MTLTSSPAWGVCRPENRVGGSPVFSSDFASQESAKPIATPSENGSCGYDFASGVHKYLYGSDNPVNRIDPSGNDDIGDLMVGMDISAGLDALPNIATVQGLLSSVSFSPSITFCFSVADGYPSTFRANDVQSTLQTELSKLVYDNPPAGHSVTIKVVDEPNSSLKPGWNGTPKNTYVNRVTWNLGGAVFSYRSPGQVYVNPPYIEQYAAGHGAITTQTWVNILAHEGIWGNAGGHSDSWFFKQDGDISVGSGPYAAFFNTPFTVLPSSRDTLRSDIGF